MEVSEESGVADVLEDMERECKEEDESAFSSMTSSGDQLDNYDNHMEQSSTLDRTQSRSDTDFQPTLLIRRYDEESIQSPKEKALNNGLDPIGIELISSSDMNTSKAGSEFSDKSDDTQGSIKVSREMKNLQKSTNDSKILSDYLHSTSESPRRNRKNKEAPRPDPDEGLEPDDMEIEREIEIMHYSPAGEDVLATPKRSPESVDASVGTGADSDSTMPIPSMDPPEIKKRKSQARSRSRSVNQVRNRKKSINQQMRDELTMTSDKDEDDEDRTSEVSYITNHSLESRSVNPPPKVNRSNHFLISNFYISFVVLARLGLVLFQVPLGLDGVIAYLLQMQMFVPQTVCTTKSHSQERRRVRLPGMLRGRDCRGFTEEQVRT